MKAIIPNFQLNTTMPLYLQLYHYIKTLILEGSILPLEKLPSLRSLSKNLNVSLTTIELAYNQLLVEGYISSKPQIERVRKRGNFRAADGQARRLFVAAKLDHEIGYCVERGVNVHARNAAAGADACFAFQGNEDRRVIEPLHQPRGRKPDDAAVPAFARQDDRPVQMEIKVREQIKGLREDFLLIFLAQRIFRVQLIRERARHRRIGRGQQIKRPARGTDPAGRVQARPDLKTQHSGSKWLFIKSRPFPQRRKPEPGISVHSVQTEFYDRSGRRCMGYGTVLINLCRF